MRIKQVVILAGGLGMRLRPLTLVNPKPMVLINGRPFLEFLVDLLKKKGIEDIVLLLGYLPEKIMEHFGDGEKFGVRIRYSVGAIGDETGARIRRAGELLNNNFLLLYGDNYWPMNLSKMIDFYQERNVDGMMTVYSNKDGGGEYGLENNVAVDADGMVTAYDQTRRDPRLNGTEIGFFILDKKVLALMPADNFSFQSVVVPQLIRQGRMAGYFTDHPYYPITNLDYLDKAVKFFSGRKVAFLDRDGIINKKMPPHDYVKSWKEFEFLPEVISALKLFQMNGYELYVITNQRGIARGLMTVEDLNAIHDRMNCELSKNNVIISAIYYCPHGAEEGCECRKPKPGMFYQAAREHYLDLSRAVYIGDEESDLAVGAAADIRTFLVSPEKNLLQAAEEIIKAD